MDLNLPASKVLVSSFKQQYLQVVDQEESVAYLEIPTGYELLKGDLLTFDEVVKGVVVDLKQNYAQVFLDSATPVRLATKQKPRLFRLPSFYRLTAEAGLGGLRVGLEDITGYQKGYLGWTLKDSNNKVLAVGNDSKEQYHCLMPSAGLWKPGTYTLSARFFYHETLMTSKAGSVRWTVDKPLEYLRVGNYYDNSSLVVAL